MELKGGTREATLKIPPAEDLGGTVVVVVVVSSTVDGVLVFAIAFHSVLLIELIHPHSVVSTNKSSINLDSAIGA